MKPIQFRVASVEAHTSDNVQTRSHDGSVKRGGQWEIVTFEAVQDESLLKVGNYCGEVYSPGFSVRIQDPERFGQYKSGDVLDLRQVRD